MQDYFGFSCPYARNEKYTRFRRHSVPIQQIFRYDRNVMTYKIVNRLCPESLWANTNRDLFTRPTIRGNVKISRSLHIGLNLQKGFLYAALKTWNDTPAEIRRLPTLDRFK